ncbi:MAG: class I SAM-dependent methyltransferase [bacterium]|nr:class I SAM-dependent methyltransferase [bacterium]
MGGNNNYKQNEMLYKQALTNFFSSQHNYWKVMYNPNHKGGNQFTNSHMRDRKKSVLKFVDLCAAGKKLKILDVGCGTGLLMRDLLKSGHDVIGIDLSTQMLIDTKKSINGFFQINSSIANGDVERLPFKDNTFDLITSIGVLEYLCSDDDGINEMTRVVKNEGHIIASLPNLLKLQNLMDPYYYFNRSFQFLLYKIKRKKKGVKNSIQESDFGDNKNFTNKRYIKKQFYNMFKKHKLQEVGIISLGFGPVTFWRKELFSREFSTKFNQYLENLCQIKYFSFLNNFPNRWVVCEQKSQN